MKKRLIFLLICVISTVFTSFAQRNLEVKDVSSGLNVFSGKDTEAGMVISCPANISLTFESSHDKVVDVYNTEQKGEEMYYYLRFQTGKRYRGRKLIIRTSEYAPVLIMAELNPKELKQYKLVDPDVEFVYGCYYEYRKRGTDFFQKCMYGEAKEQYGIAKECSDCPADSNLDELIASIDTIIVCQDKAEEAYQLLDYEKASMYYGRILELNPSDTNASNKRYECIRYFDTDCNKYYDAAEVYYEDGEYDKALELYQRVVDQNCGNAVQASEKAKNIRVMQQSRNQRVQVYAYEYSKSAPIGITIGKYRQRKVGGYFSLSFHPDLFKALQKDYSKQLEAEMNLSFGWTINPVRKLPVWIFFGPGYTGVGEFVDEDGNPYIESDEDSSLSGNDGNQNSDKKDPSFKLYSAISAEVGLLGKIGPLVLRYTYQLRFSVSKEYEDKISRSRHVFGVGFCF